ncbi:helix-turn-helix transcriptional regulator [Pseudomonas sp. SWI7]|jgi:phage repressor protein C with HTH and peptisase S24 domain|uniref:LexA family transcriptional regulator n=1 Tax=Pseudomonas sp. SWI7 TaxID=2587597 RepID=UPI00112399D7|nr:helix-turn-helix transcriptional regulator [Pseudomonas sp. SWI7]QDC04722.1 helix-turn-helix transcriptional regulator [Pseudomonas sp. SWI7]
MNYSQRLKAARKHAKLTQAELSKAVGITQTSISDLETGKSASSTFGASIARICGVSALWLETGEGSMTEQGQGHGPSDARSNDPKSNETINIEGLPAPLAQKIKSYRNLVDVPRYDVEGSMGPGSEPPDINMVVEHMSLDANWVRQNLTYTKLENLKLISGRGDSMAPTIRSGDAVLVDAGVTTVEDDAIYFFLMRGKLQIKRIQRGLDGLTIISDNGQYPPIEVPGEREDDIKILAQIIYWWTGRSF